MKDGIKFFIFLAVIVGVAVTFVKPLNERLADLFPSQAGKEEKQFLGGVSGRNPNIEEIQQMLKDLKFYAGAVDGKMGSQTRKALEAFQKENNISVTGRVDAKTLHELRRQTLLKAKDADTPVRRRTSPSGQKISYDIKNIQALLQKAGFYKGKIDGKMGPQTVKAIKQFQRSKNLKESGVINMRTWNELKKFESGK